LLPPRQINPATASKTSGTNSLSDGCSGFSFPVAGINLNEALF